MENNEECKIGDFMLLVFSEEILNHLATYPRDALRDII